MAKLICEGWLASKNKLDKAELVLNKHYGHVEGYDAREQLAIMVATVEEERRISAHNKNIGRLAVVQGTNGWRLIIAAWPKIMQQLVGLSVFNTYSTYFCKSQV